MNILLAISDAHEHSGDIWHAILHALEHSLLDTLISIPLLFLAYLLMEFLERKASAKMERTLGKIGPYGPIVGSLLGCVPQCGFSASASNLYTAGLITEGTLISVFLSTSDEAMIMLFSSPGSALEIIKLLITKIIFGIIFGFLLDGILKATRTKKVSVEMCKDCGCEEEKSIFLPALKHTLKMTLFIFVINLVLGFGMELLGDDKISQFLLSDSPFQPFVTALVGLIPNCAVSAIITKLYIAGHLSFGSTIAGLSTGAGIGLAVLFKSNPVKKENLRIVAFLYVSAVLCGILLNIIGL
ncbi:MAG: arsenic efflux protein [Clostridia bacterium]|nr:arsenic efflux protein [Clostridia bacterium]